MRPSKQILNAPRHIRGFSSGPQSSFDALPSFHAVLRTVTFAAAFLFVTACVLGAI